jgi:prepilin-type N-terminal cleavage/methylation domain-containing protein
MQIKNNNQRGYTIIETMIAVSIFLIVVMIGMGALLNANSLHHRSQNMRSIMDNLSFIMEDISRNLRTGYNYHCGDSSSIETPLSCVSGDIIYFEKSDGDAEDNTDQYGYKIDLAQNATDYAIYRTTDGGGTWILLTSEEIKIDATNSSFIISGAEPVVSDAQQPFATIRLIGNILYKTDSTPFSLQTSVSQRLLDR